MKKLPKLTIKDSGSIIDINGSFGIAGFCAAIVGALLAFLWFNIYPARFIMGDTGALALGATLGVIAMLTNTFIALIIISAVFLAEIMSVIIQVCYRKTHHQKKLFLSAPLHHHLEAIGWPETKVTMRFWLISIILIISIFLSLLLLQRFL